MARNIVTLASVTLESSVRRADWLDALVNETTRNTTELVGLELDPPYQRTSVWTTDQRRRLMRSFLTGLPVPAVICNDRFTHGSFEAPVGMQDYRVAVVDGKQRIETLLAWRAGTLALPAAWFNPEDVTASSGGYLTRADLSDTGRRVVDGRLHFPVATAALPTVRAEAELYLLLNEGGTAHTSDDLARARALLA